MTETPKERFLHVCKRVATHIHSIRIRDQFIMDQIKKNDESIRLVEREMNMLWSEYENMTEKEGG